jgi:hypothetical protein
MLWRYYVCGAALSAVHRASAVPEAFRFFREKGSQMSNVIGSFGKGVDGSVSINFGVSGGKNCSKRCRHHPESKRKNRTRACYAAKLEQRPDRQQLTAKLQRHDALPAWKLCGMALVELQDLEARGVLPPWVRFSTNGSLPMPSEISGLFRNQLRALVSWIVTRQIPVHLPIETADKARFYREILGDIVTVRESLQEPGSHASAPGPVSWVAGSDISGKDTFKRRIDAARQECRERFLALGRKAIVCPAVVAGFLARMKGGTKNGKAKCGNCTACSQDHIDVCYPQHN